VNYVQAKEASAKASSPTDEADDAPLGSAFSLIASTMSSRQDESSQGSSTLVEEGAGYRVNRIELLPGKRLSYQRHSRRSEEWTIVQGLGKVTINGDERLVRVGQKVNVPAGAAHRMENFGAETLIFDETQRGSYLGEDDIERLEDDYGKVPEEA
jgi:mannose-6-phosphate isomerase